MGERIRGSLASAVRLIAEVARPIGHLHVVGHSFGGQVALDFALLVPQQTVDHVWRSGCLVAQCGEQPVEVLAARAAGVQVRRDPRVALLGRLARRHQLGIDVQYLYSLGASHIARIGLQETVQF